MAPRGTIDPAKDMDRATRERLAELNPELRDELLPEDRAPSSKPGRRAAPAPASPAGAAAGTPKASPSSAGRRTKPRAAASRARGASRSVRKSAPARAVRTAARSTGVPQSTTQLVTYFAGATLVTVILAQLITGRGSSAAATVIGTATAAVRRLADPADPLITTGG